MKPEDIIAELLDDLCLEHGFKTDIELAEHLGTSTVSLWRWRHGYLDKSTRILVPILWRRAEQQPDEIAA